jgi:hypothetical protein
MMECPGDQFFSCSAGPLDQDGTLALGDLRKNRKDGEHGGIFTDDVFEPMLFLKGFLKGADCAQVPKGLHNTFNLAVSVAQDGGGHTYGDLFFIGTVNVHRNIEDRTCRFHGSAQHAVAFTDICPENLEAWFADSFRSSNSRDLLCSTVERGDGKIEIDSKYPVRYAV